MKNQIWYVNGKLFIGGRFLKGSFCVSDGKIVKVLTEEKDCGEAGFDSPEVSGKAAGDSSEKGMFLNLNGAYVIPGLIDLHIHGAAGYDFSDGDAGGLIKIAGFLASRGVTSFLPTTMTIAREDYLKAADAMKQVQRESAVSGGLARIPGMRMEGPFLSKEKCGAQNPVFLRTPDHEFFREIMERSGNGVAILDLASELAGAEEFIKKAAGETLISLAHTNADYEEATAAFVAGAKHVTHLYNAMRPFLHREPGLIGALWDSEGTTAEIIGDGYHVHESAVRTAFKMMPHRICLVSDALRCLGVPEGEYELSGQTVICKDGVARLKNGTLAGSSTDLFEMMKRVISFGVPKEEVIEAVTETPAKIIGSKTVGILEEGRFADFIVSDENFDHKKVYIGGNAVETVKGI